MKSNLKMQRETQTNNYSPLVATFSIVCAFLLQACATVAKIDEGYTSKDPSFQKAYSAPVAKCVDASKKALKELGAEIESEKKGDIVTNRYSAFRAAKAVYNGNYSATAVYSEQTVKIHARVSAQGSGCLVRLVSIRAWQDGVEFETLNVDFAQKRAVVPFFKNLDEAISE